jgi:hypothetical protein
MQTTTKRSTLRTPAGLARRLAAWLGTVMLAAAAHAQPAPAPDVDPPARVGRISLLTGPVTLTDRRTGEDSEASLNWPLTSDQSLTTGRQGRAEVRIGSTSLRVDGDSTVDFDRIDDEAILLTVQRGSIALRIRNRDLLREIDVLTPRERIVFEDVGRYRIDVDRTPGMTAVTTHVGTARLLGGRAELVIHSGQRGEASAEPRAVYQLVTPASDVFDDWVATRDRRDDSLLSTRYVSPETSGVESLDDNGEWRSVETYGAVWFPTAVAAGWAPYRYGRWVYVEPWGWTWIDDAPWGFTPFHYGRWVYVYNRWGWVPGDYVARPCYAPALVAWYGTPGLSVSIGIGGPVGWFPLGPGEIYIPGYRYSRRYINFVNYGHVTNIHYITVINPPPRYRYREPNYSTWADRDALVRRTPVQRVVRSAPNEWVKLPTAPQPPVKTPDDYQPRKPRKITTVAPPDVGHRPADDRAGRPDDVTRVSPPPRAPGRERPDGRDARSEPPVRPPVARVAPREDSGPAAPRVPRTGAPRAEPPQTGAPVAPRPPKVRPVEPAPVRPPAQVGANPPQSVPRSAPRTETPAPRFEAPRAREPASDVVPRPKPALRAVEPQRGEGRGKGNAREQ